MGKEQPPEYYDQIYKRSDEYRKHWTHSRYVRVWDAMASYLDKQVMVIDLGCGVGQAAAMMRSMGFEKYMGVDSSFEAIRIATGADSPFLNEPQYSFVLGDVFKIADQFNDNLCSVTCQFFISETLEHIEKDTELLKILQRKVPDGKIAISVPTFNDPSHVRHFKDEKDASARYAPFINIEISKQIGPWIVICGTLIKPL